MNKVRGVQAFSAPSVLRLSSWHRQRFNVSQQYPPPPPFASTQKVRKRTARLGPGAWTRQCFRVVHGTKRTYVTENLPIPHPKHNCCIRALEHNVQANFSKFWRSSLPIVPLLTAVNAKPDSHSDCDRDSGTDSDSELLTSDDSPACLDSGEDDEVQIVWAKAGGGIWGLGHVFEGKLHLKHC